MLKNILYISGSVAVFFTGMICYGIILNLREVPLDEAMREKGLTKIENVKLVVNRRDYRIELYSNKIFVKSYKAVFGKNTSTVKNSKNDMVTPVGEYRICEMDTSSKYHKFLRLNYPNEKDAGEAMKRRYISEEEFDAILLAQSRNDCPPRDTRLGADIGIQGIGEYDLIFRNLPFSFNWTNGSIAVSNKSIDEIYSVVKIGTTVKITF
jgi:murein L,D-transpeptidase YafK